MQHLFPAFSLSLSLSLSGLNYTAPPSPSLFLSLSLSLSLSLLSMQGLARFLEQYEDDLFDAIALGDWQWCQELFQKGLGPNTKSTVSTTTVYLTSMQERPIDIAPYITWQLCGIQLQAGYQRSPLAYNFVQEFHFGLHGRPKN